MNLVKSRREMQDRWQSGDRPSFLSEYEINRTSELWRTSRFTEELCEYILYLEQQVKQSQE